MRHFKTFLTLLSTGFVCIGICYYNFVYIDFGNVLYVNQMISTVFSLICIFSLMSLLLSIIIIIDNFFLKKQVQRLMKNTEDVYDNIVDFMDTYTYIAVKLQHKTNKYKHPKRKDIE